MCLNVFVSVHVHALKPEKYIRSHEDGVTGSYEPSDMNAGTEFRSSSGRVAYTLNH